MFETLAVNWAAQKERPILSLFADGDRASEFSVQVDHATSRQPFVFECISPHTPNLFLSRDEVLSDDTETCARLNRIFFCNVASSCSSTSTV